MNDYRCEHGGMAMGRDCAQCEALYPISRLRPGSVHLGFEDGKKVFRTVVDTTFGKSVIYRKANGVEQRCTGEEWLAFVGTRST